jgi:hypothetical protein
MDTGTITNAYGVREKVTMTLHLTQEEKLRWW